MAGGGGRAGARALVMVAVTVNVVSAVWRYSNNMGSRSSINTRSTLHLEYEGDSFFQWIVPNPCTVSFPTSPSVTLSCNLRGVYTIYPRVFNQTIEDAPRAFNIEAALFNFIWYMVKMPESHTSDVEEDLIGGYLNTTQRDILRIWIVDPEKASSTELNNKAEFPSLLLFSFWKEAVEEYLRVNFPQQTRLLSVTTVTLIFLKMLSSALTKEFFNLGQDLQLKWYPIEHRYKTQFNSEHGYWTVTIYNVTTEIILTISGKALTFQNLFIMDTSYTIEKRLDLSVIKALGYLSLRMADGSNPLIVYHQCSSSSTLLLTDFGTFISHDGFVTVEELKIVPTEQQHIEQNKVRTAAFLWTNILLLLGNELYVRYAKGFNNKLGIEYGLPEEGVLGLISRMSCATGYPVKGEGILSSVAVWTKRSVYLLSFKKTKYVKHLRIPDWSSVITTIKPDSIKICTVSYGSRPPDVGVLIEATDINDKRRLLLTIYNEETKTWVLSSLFFHTTSDYLPAGPLHMQFIVSALPAVFIWNNNSVHYSLRNNSISGKLHVNGVEDLSKAMEGSSIHQVIFDHKLNILIKMNNNLMLFGVVGTNALVKLHTWERKDSKIILYSNFLSQISIIKLRSFVIHESIYPLQMEVFSSLFMIKAPACPFKKFSHNLEYPLYYVDMGESLYFQAEVIYLNEIGLHIDLIHYNKDLIYSEVCSQYEITTTFYIISEHLHLYHKKDYRNLKNYTAELEATSGVLSVEFQVNRIEYSCESSEMRVAHVAVGCPPNKHITVVRPSINECRFEYKKRIMVPRSVLREPSTKDLEYTYNIEKYGCPIFVHHKSPFKPTIELYLGLKYLGVVYANYIIWEEYGRRDFFYNATMEQVGCLREAQTWDSMLSLSGIYKDIGDAWGPENYRSCYETPGLIRKMHRPYEILNSSNSVFITWPTDYTGIYLFTVKVLDSNYSFCKLTAHFAVETYGEINRKDSTMVLSLVWSFIFILLSSFAYSYYKYMSIFSEMLYQ